MRSVVDDAAIIDDQNAVSPNHCRQAVRDDKVRSALHQV